MRNLVIVCFFESVRRICDRFQHRQSVKPWVLAIIAHDPVETPVRSPLGNHKRHQSERKMTLTPLADLRQRRIAVLQHLNDVLAAAR